MLLQDLLMQSLEIPRLLCLCEYIFYYLTNLKKEQKNFCKIIINFLIFCNKYSSKIYNRQFDSYLDSRKLI